MPTQALLPRNLLSSTAVTVALLALSIALPARAADTASCHMVLDAMKKQGSIPTHMYMTKAETPHGGKPSTSELISVGGKTYIQVGGTWQRSLMTQEERQKQGRRTSKAPRCSRAAIFATRR
jgi:hypothetical protein